MPSYRTISRTCERCGATFMKTPSAIANGRGRFCSRACQNAAQARHVTMACETCGAGVERKRSAIRGRAFCSDACSRARNAQPIVLSDDGLTAQIPLVTRDGAIVAYATIDATDAEWAGQWTWNLSKQGRYAVRQGGIKLHRELLGLTRHDGLEGDHINLNKLDNRRSNLRVLTRPQNAQNLPTRPGTSSYRGVSWSERMGQWAAYVSVGGKRHHLGFFVDEAEAANVAREARARMLPYATN